MQELYHVVIVIGKSRRQQSDHHECLLKSHCHLHRIFYNTAKLIMYPARNTQDVKEYCTTRILPWIPVVKSSTRCWPPRTPPPPSSLATKIFLIVPATAAQRERE